MFDSNSRPGRTRSWVTSPGTLFTITLSLLSGSLYIWFNWRVHQQHRNLQYFEQFEPEIITEPSDPLWVRQLIDAAVGEEQAAGFAEIALIDLSSTHIADADLSRLSQFPNLQVLVLARTQITDAGLEHLTGIPNLRHLSLANTQITDAGLRHLSSLANLEYLCLTDTRITDDGLQHLSAITSLKKLIANGTQLTDGGLEHLERMVNVERLSLNRTQITDAGKSRVQAALPGCLITTRSTRRDGATQRHDLND